MAGVVWYLMNRTGLGVAIKAVGDNPNSVDAQGLIVYGLRIGAIVAGSALMALGGAFLTMSAFDCFFLWNGQWKGLDLYSFGYLC